MDRPMRLFLLIAYAWNWRGLSTAALQSLTVVLAFVLICFFAGLFGWSVIQTWRAAPGSPPTYSDAFVYVATALAALVGGIVAFAFGQAKGTAATLDWLAILTGVYAVVYVVLGLLTLLTWVFKTRETPVLLKNLATTFLGLAIPIVAAFFRQAWTIFR